MCYHAIISSPREYHWNALVGVHQISRYYFIYSSRQAKASILIQKLMPKLHFITLSWKLCLHIESWSKQLQFSNTCHIINWGKPKFILDSSEVVFNMSKASCMLRSYSLRVALLTFNDNDWATLVLWSSLVIFSILRERKGSSLLKSSHVHNQRNIPKLRYP